MSEELLKEVNKLKEQHKIALLDTFTGIPVRIDFELAGYEYYISVSPGLYDYLKENKEHE